jgi:hypothetical protein
MNIPFLPFARAAPQPPPSGVRGPEIVVVGLLLLWAAALVSPAQAQESTEAEPPVALPVEAVRLTGAEEPEIQLDGLLAETFWARTGVITGFRQQEPLEGEPATEVTEVRIAFDDATMYVGIRALDSNPEAIVGRILQRDRIMEVGGFANQLSATGDDVVAIVLDPFHDHRNGMVFATNPNGAEFDALVTDEGGEVNIDWRGIWRVKAARIPEGWSAEIAIPFRTLRYPTDGGVEPWGFNVYRMIRRKNEEVLWRSWSRDNEGFNRISQAGHLSGLTELPRPGLNLEVKPYALGGSTQERDELTGATPTELDSKIGLDLKTEVAGGLVLDLTLNTDFAQVEVDDEQVNLTRFNLFFPEKRDFFLENAGIFEFGDRGFFEQPPFLLFFSRQIGISEDGEVPILAGARLTGRAGQQTIGLLNVVTDEAFEEPVTNFAVVRAKRDIGENSYLGVMLTDRRSRDTWNTTAGVDGTFWFGTKLTTEAFLAYTFTEGDGGDDVAFRGAVDYTSDRYGLFFQHMGIGPEVNADMGFVTRTDVHRSRGGGRYTARPSFLSLRKIDFFLGGDYFADFSGARQDWEIGPTLLPEWDSGDGGRFEIDFAEQTVTEAFDLADTVLVEPGVYGANNVQLAFNSSPARPLVGQLQATVGESFGGTVNTLGGSLTWNPTPKVGVTGGYTRNDVSLPNGAFVADIASLRGTYSFSTQATLNAFVQYNSLNDALITNIRFNYIYRPGSDLFLVFTEERGGTDFGDQENRGMVAKLTYLHRF